MTQDRLSPDWGLAQVYAILSLGTRRLMLPQSEIQLLESVLDVEVGAPPQNGLGWLAFDGEQWPVYGLDQNLNPLSRLPLTHRICALVNRAEGYFGLVCADVITVEATELNIRPLPAAMARGQSPVRGLALQGEQLMLVSQSDALAEFLGMVHEPMNAQPGNGELATVTAKSMIEN